MHLRYLPWLISIGAHFGALVCLLAVLRFSTPLRDDARLRGLTNGPLDLEWVEHVSKKTRREAHPGPAHDQPSFQRPTSTEADAALRSSPLAGASGGASSSAGPVSLNAGDPYFAQVRSRIQSHVTYPPSLARKRLRGRVEVELSILPTGQLGSISVQETSGFGELDDLALESVRSASPFPAFNPSEPARKLRIPIDFRLR